MAKKKNQVLNSLVNRRRPIAYLSIEKRNGKYRYPGYAVQLNLLTRPTINYAFLLYKNKYTIYIYICRDKIIHIYHIYT